MLLRFGGCRVVGFVSCSDGCAGSLDDICQFAAVRDRAAVSAQEHGPPASGTAWLAPDCRAADFGAGFADSLHCSHRDGPHVLAAK